MQSEHILNAENSALDLGKLNFDAIDVAIFDFDGTIVDSTPIYHAIYREVLRKLSVSNRDMEYLTYDFWQEHLNTNKKHVDVVGYLINRHKLENKTTPITFRKMRNDIECDYFDGCYPLKELDDNPKSYVFSDVITQMKKHKASGAAVHVVSHNYGFVVSFILASLGMFSLIDGFHTHCEHDELKTESDTNLPKEETFAQLVRKAGNEDPTRCIVYDDLDVHLSNARNLGMQAMRVDASLRTASLCD